MNFRHRLGLALTLATVVLVILSIFLLPAGVEVAAKCLAIACIVLGLVVVLAVWDMFKE